MKESDKSKPEISVDIQDQDAIFNEVHDYFVELGMKALAKKIEEIYNYDEEDLFGDEPLQMDSLLALQDFIKKNILYIEPKIGFSPRGYLVVRWKFENSRQVLIHFYDRINLRYYIELGNVLEKDDSNIEDIDKVLSSLQEM